MLRSRRSHLGVLTATDRAQVDTFYAEAIKAGGTENGPPGLRAKYHPTYYGAFVISPGGHSVEAVVHRAPEAGN